MTLKGLFRDTGFYGLQRIIPAVGQIVILPLLTACLSPQDYGILAITAALSGGLTLVMWLNMNAGVLRFYHEHEGEERRRFLGTVGLGSLVYAAAVAALAIVAGTLFWPVSAVGGIEFWPIVGSLIVTCALSTAVIVPSAVFKAEGRAAAWSFLQLVSWALSTGLSLWFVIAHREGPWGMIKGQFIGTAVMFALYWTLTLKHIEWRWDPRMFKENVAFGLPILGKNSALFGYQFSDRFIMERLVSMAEVGLFSVADSIARMFLLVYNSAADAWMPAFYRAAKQDRQGAGQLAGRFWVVWAIGLTWALFCFAVLVDPFLTALLNERYHSETVFTSARLLVLAYYFTALQLVPLYVLSYEKRNMPLLYATCAALVINVVVNASFMPFLGVYVAAWARVLAHAIVMVWIFRAAQQTAKVKYRFGLVGKATLAGLLLYAANEQLVHWAGGWKWVSAGGAIFVYSAWLLFSGAVDLPGARTAIRSLRKKRDTVLS